MTLTTGEGGVPGRSSCRAEAEKSGGPTTEPRGHLAASIEVTRKVVAVGGWAPLMVFLIHAIASHGFQAYEVMPQTDIPMHFAGGLAIAFFVSRCFRAVARDVARRGRLVVLEAVLVASLTTTAAVVWEFAEFSLDQLIGTNVQVSLANTMQDMAVGMLGAGVLVACRARQLHAGPADVREVAAEWLSGAHTSGRIRA